MFKRLIILFLIVVSFPVFPQTPPPTPSLTPEQIAKHPTDKWFTAERPDYSKLDARVRELAKNEETPQAVAKIVCEGLETDIEKARAIFDWLAYNIAYDKRYSIYDGEKAFKKRKGVCQGYAELFQIMADTVNLNSKMVTGTGYGGPNVGRAGHAWNIVKLPERDILIDACWGAGYTTGSSFKFEFAPAWFDTHPAAFVYTHLPDYLDDECIYPYLSYKDFTKLSWTRAEHFYPYGTIDPVENYHNKFCMDDENLPVTISSYRNTKCWSKYISTGPELTDGFFITDFEITPGFLDDFLSEEELVSVRNKNYEHKVVSASSDLPLYLIAKYCNERSKSYGLEQCYTINRNEDSSYKIECDYSKCGFRLPAKKEWLLACGTKYLDTTLSEKDFSDSVWYNKNSGGRIRIVKQTKQNENELCDMLGNVSELCYDEETNQYVFMGGNVFSTREEIQALIPVPFDDYTEQKGAHGFRLVFNAPKNPELQFVIANFYSGSTILEENQDSYIQWLKLAVDGGNAGAMAYLASEYYKTATPEGYKKCYDLCMKAAESEYHSALYLLGVMYKNGTYVRKDEKKAFEYYERSANARNLYAMYETSQYYKEGKVIPQNYEQYFYWLNRCVEGGLKNETAKIELARCFKYGTGCEVDQKKAFKLFEELAKQKDPSILALVEYADCYAEACGCSQNWYSAIYYYKQALEKGSVYAKAQLSECAYFGRGMPRDIQAAAQAYTEIINGKNSTADYENRAQLFNAVLEAMNFYDDCCKNFLNDIPADEDPALYIQTLLSISACTEKIQGIPLTNSALLRGLSLDDLNNKVLGPMQSVTDSKTLLGKTLVVINPYKGKEFTGLQKLIFNSECFNQKKYKVNGEYYKYDKAFYEYYDNLIFLQKQESDLSCIDTAFENLTEALANCSEVDLLLFSTDFFAQDSTYVQLYKQTAEKMIDKGAHPRIIIFGNKTDSIQENMNKVFSEETAQKINVFGTPYNMLGELACGFRNDKLFIVQLTEKLNDRRLLIYLDETGWTPEPTRKETTFVQSKQSFSKLTGIGFNKSGTITKSGKMVMHYKVCK